MPLTPLAGTLGTKRAAHLLRRTSTGASIAEINQFALMTAEEAVQALFNPELPTPSPPIDPSTGEDWINQAPDPESDDGDLHNYMINWMFGQNLAPGIADDLSVSYRFRERIVFFFHTIFTTKRSKVRESRQLYYQNALFRIFAFDGEDRLSAIPTSDPDNPNGPPLPPIVYPVNMKQLTKKISVENGMLVFLDGRQNLSGSPNENYARELLELYSIGRGLEGNLPSPEFDGDYVHFTEEDVQAGARVLSGFDVDDTYSNYDTETGLPRGVIRGNGQIANRHDNTTKQFSTRLDEATISPDAELMIGNNPTEASILDEISQLVELIYSKDETAIHICRRLYRFFIYHEIDESVQSGLIQDLAEVFQANDFKLQPVLEALFTSQEFYEGAVGVTDDFYGSIIKSPLDLIVGFVNNFNIAVPVMEEDPEMFYDFMRGLRSAMNAQGMDYYEPFEVAGYSAFHQFPIYNRSWITTNYLTNRYDFINSRVTPGDLVEMGDLNPLNFVRTQIDDAIARDARQLVITLAGYFLPMGENLDFGGAADSELTQERLNYFLETFLSDMDADPEVTWTAEWDARSDDEKQDNQLANLLNALLQSPEYQLM